MKSQTLILLVVAAGCGLVAMLGVQQVLNKQDGPDVEMVEVLSAATEITVGETLTDLNTRIIAVPVEQCPEGVITSLADTEHKSLRIPAMPGDWITVSKLVEGTGATASIPPGMRVATIPVDSTTSHSGMLQAGNRVDVNLTYDEILEGGRSQKVIRTILQYIEIFAVDDKVYGVDKEGAPNAKNISLLVSADEARLLKLAEQKGKISTVLRSNEDEEQESNVELADDALRSVLSGDANPSLLSYRAQFEENSTDGVRAALAAAYGDINTEPESLPEIPSPESKADSYHIITIYEGENPRYARVHSSPLTNGMKLELSRQADEAAVAPAASSPTSPELPEIELPFGEFPETAAAENSEFWDFITSQIRN